MEVRAVAKYVRVQPRKVRIVADKIRGESAVKCVHLLRYQPSKGAKMLHKVLVSAIANAAENHGLNPDGLRISTIMVDEGPYLKRIQARAMGRAYRILKKTSHITVVVEEGEEPRAQKAHGTRPKPRPKFEAPKPAKKKKEDVAAPVAEEAPVEAVATEEVQAEAAPEVAEATAEAPAEEAAAESESTEAPAAEETAAEGEEGKGA